MTTLTPSARDPHWHGMRKLRGCGLVLSLLVGIASCGNVNTLATRTKDEADSAGAGAGGRSEPMAGMAGSTTAEGGEPPASAGKAGEQGIGGALNDCENACEVGQACKGGRCLDCSSQLMPPLIQSAITGIGRGIVIGDFNGDGLNDRAYTDSIGLHLELGSATGLLPPADYQFPGEASPQILYSADLDGDDKLDLVLPGADDNLRLMWGDDAGFSESRLAASGRVVHGDFDGDQRFDLAVYREGSVTLAWGRADRSFELGPTASTFEGATDMVALDVDDDGKLDLTFGAENMLQTFTGDGQGGFTPKLSNDIPGLRGFSIADVDGDSKPDLLIGKARSGDDESWITGRVSLFSDFRGVLFAGAVNYVAGDGRAPRVADLNGDGQLDILTFNAQNRALDVLLGSSDGSFQTRRAFSLGPTVLGFALGDLDGDRRPDVSTVGTWLTTTAYNQGSELFGQRVYPLPESPEQLLLKDVTGDGHIDALVTNNWGNVLSLLAGSPDGQFADPEYLTHDPENIGGYSSPIVAEDFDGDGKLELAIVRNDAGLSLYRRGAANRFELARVLDWPGNPTSLSTGDLNDDGKLDIIATVGRSNAVRVRLGRGNGDFESSVDYSTLGWPNDSFVDDIDRDGKLDVVVADFSDNSISVLHGRGDGTLEPPITTPLAESPLGMQHADLNADARTDIVVNFRGRISILLGTRDGSFADEVVYDSVSPNDHSGNSNPAIALADLNGDGLLDVATVEERSGNFSGTADSSIAVLHGRGDGTLLPPIRYPTGSSPSALAAADLDHDGKPDLAAIMLLSRTLNVLSNHSHCE